VQVRIYAITKVSEEHNGPDIGLGHFSCWWRRCSRTRRSKPVGGILGLRNGAAPGVLRQIESDAGLGDGRGAEAVALVIEEERLTREGVCFNRLS